MARKIKITKNELKAQRDALGRFRRYLPTLELKKQQLQMEVRKLQAAREEKRKALDGLFAGMRPWRKLFSEDAGLDTLVAAPKISGEAANIAGVDITVFQEAVFERKDIDLFASAPWIDDAIAFLERASSMRIELETIERNIALLGEELRVTSQRVNLFEKVKIPEAAENIRVIRIFLGDMDTAAVARAKLAKSKSLKAMEAV